MERIRASFCQPCVHRRLLHLNTQKTLLRSNLRFRESISKARVRWPTFHSRRKAMTAAAATGESDGRSTIQSLQGHADRALGALLGCFCGDALGAAVEGSYSRLIHEAFPEGLRDLQRSKRGYGKYTDDTQMTLALMRSLVKRGRADAGDCAAEYAAHYDPSRGYGGAAHKVMQALRAGKSHLDTGTMQFPEGSFANGGAMRIAPIGLAYRNADDEVLRRAVTDALQCTHVHPDAIDGAFVQAAAVAALSRSSPGGEGPAPTPEALLALLRSRAATPAMRERLRELARALAELQKPEWTVVAARPADSFWEGGPNAAWEFDMRLLDRVSEPFQIKAVDAVACALWALSRHWTCPEAAVVAAVHYGGDTDTVAAMAGAMAGALHGTAWIPDRWWDNLENGKDGRDAFVRDALRLAELDVQK